MLEETSRRCARLLALAGVLCLAACGDKGGGGGPGPDTEAPTFGGLNSAVVMTNGDVQLYWTLAVDDSLPITYEVFHARTSHGQDFGVPITTVQDATSVVVSGLESTAGALHYFVVRARDSVGNSDDNTVERSIEFPYNGLKQVGHYDMTLASDVAVDGQRDVAVISGWQSGNVLVIDVATKANPALLDTITGQGYSPDIQVKDTWLYISHEYEGRGFDIVDLTDPSNATVVKQVGPSTGYPAPLEDCHNLFPQPDRDLLYCASTTTGELVILSTGEGAQGAPDDPVYLTKLSAPGGAYGIHDMVARGNLLYAAYLDVGFRIYDITDASNPVEVGSKGYANDFTHNLWPTDDGKYLLTTDENEGGHIRIWDISNLNDIQQVAEYQPNPFAIVHNVEIVGNLAYISHYTEGVKVLDITDPTAPEEVGAHDFYDGPDQTGDIYDSFRGAWGVDPHPPWVYVSGMQSGLWIYEFVPKPAAN